MRATAAREEYAMRIKVDAAAVFGPGSLLHGQPRAVPERRRGLRGPERHRVRRRRRGRGCGPAGGGVVPRGCDQRGRRDVNAAAPSTDVDVARLADTAAVVDVCVRIRPRPRPARLGAAGARASPTTPSSSSRGWSRCTAGGASVDVCRGALEPLDASQHLLGNHHVDDRRRPAAASATARPARARRARPGRQVRRRRHLPSTRCARRDGRRGRSRAAVSQVSLDRRQPRRARHALRSPS